MTVNGRDIGPRVRSTMDDEPGDAATKHLQSVDEHLASGLDFDETASPWYDDGAPEPEANHLHRLIVQQAAEMLPADLRQVYDAVYVRDLSYRAAAAEIGISHQQVMRRARKVEESIRRAVESAGLDG